MDWVFNDRKSHPKPLEGKVKHKWTTNDWFRCLRMTNMSCLCQWIPWALNRLRSQWAAGNRKRNHSASLEPFSQGAIYLKWASGVMEQLVWVDHVYSHSHSCRHFPQRPRTHSLPCDFCACQDLDYVWGRDLKNETKLCCGFWQRYGLFEQH